MYMYFGHMLVFSVRVCVDT